ncbi:glycosyltransferase family 1 protein, partial [Fulvivirga sp. RKSG066]|uniref:glycosyltransferase family 4 protein n=1 Tax=Fulvivirga aurantia TaxID=2529383 RepID=UPI0012BD6995
PISLKVLLNGQLEFMKSHGFEVHTASANGKEVKEITRYTTHHQIGFTRTISPFKDLIALIQLIRLMKKINPDIVHTHTPKAGLLGMIAAWVCNVPIRMHTVAGMPLMEARGISKHILKITERITYKCATNVYPNSFKLRDWITKGFKKYNKKTRVIANGSSNGINGDYFSLESDVKAKACELRSELDIPDQALVYVFVGRLVRDKGINELVDAFVKFNSGVDKESYLLLVGDFEDEREPVLNEVKREIELNDKIKAVGFQKDIRPYLALSDVFVFPSYREGFPNVVMQAGCFNLPIIATNINGCNELISHRKNGLLVPPKKIEVLVEAMTDLVDAPTRNALSQNSREMILSKFDQKHVWNSILKEYRRLLTLHNVR